MAPGSCERCGGTLIEVDSYGTLIAGCLMCNDWRSVDGMRRVKLPDAAAQDPTPGHALTSNYGLVCWETGVLVPPVKALTASAFNFSGSNSPSLAHAMR